MVKKCISSDWEATAWLRLFGVPVSEQSVCLNVWSLQSQRVKGWSTAMCTSIQRPVVPPKRGSNTEDAKVLVAIRRRRDSVASRRRSRHARYYWNSLR